MCKRQMRFLRYAVKSGIEECRRKAFIQGIYYNSASTYTFPIAFPTHGLGASATGSINYWLTNTAIGITDMNLGDNVKQPGFVLCVGY